MLFHGTVTKYLPSSSSSSSSGGSGKGSGTRGRRSSKLNDNDNTNDNKNDNTDSTDNDNDELYHIVWDDGDEQDYDAAELLTGKNRFESEKIKEEKKLEGDVRKRKRVTM